jgi:hypothetical protein
MVAAWDYHYGSASHSQPLRRTYAKATFLAMAALSGCCRLQGEVKYYNLQSNHAMGIEFQDTLTIDAVVVTPAFAFLDNGVTLQSWIPT